jgi:plasmid maintenance system antidote protein VapI
LDKGTTDELIKAKRGVTAEAALDLADALGTSARLWMNLQTTFGLAAVERKRHKAQKAIPARTLDGSLINLPPCL